MATDALIDDLLCRGADDWVTAAEVAWISRSIGGALTDDDVFTLSVDLIRSVLNDGLMDAGDVTDGGFFEWLLPPNGAVARIEDSWRQLGGLLTSGRFAGSRLPQRVELERSAAANSGLSCDKGAVVCAGPPSGSFFRIRHTSTLFLVTASPVPISLSVVRPAVDGLGGWLASSYR